MVSSVVLESESVTNGLAPKHVSQRTGKSEDSTPALFKSDLGGIIGEE